MLRYLWIPSYKNINSQGFNFDSSLNASYNPESSVLEIINTLEKQLPVNFYGSNIELVTGVLGENGAGKSALVSAILETAGSFTNGAARNLPPCIFIFGNTIVHQVDLLLRNNKSLTKAGYRIHNYKETINYNQLLTNNPFWQENERVSITQHFYVHYANFMDSPWYYQFGVVDVSTSHMLNNINERNINLRDGKIDSLANYRTRDFEWDVKALNYLYGAVENPLPFAPPRLLQLEAYPLEKIYNIRIDKDFFEVLEAKNLKNWVDQLENQLNEADKLPFIEEFIVRFILPRLLLLVRIYAKELRKFSNKILQQLLTIKGNVPQTNNKDLNKQLLTIYEFASFIREQAEANHIFPLSEPKQYNRVVTRTINIDITAVPLREFVNLFARISDAPNNTQTFEANWHGLSSGQIAYLRLYSRLYQALSRIQEKNNSDLYNIKSLTILIDEGETGFHPQWQKNYIQLLIGIITMLFGEFRIQLIVCSNSPFIASDIPQSNLLLLHRQENGSCEVKPWMGMEKTFASNIHTLLTESFFMSDGLMGDFARDKVSELIKYLQHKPAAQDERREEMQVVLEMIGEPVVRMKLREMWAENFGTAERIADLERQIVILKRQQENG